MATPTSRQMWPNTCCGSSSCARWPSAGSVAKLACGTSCGHALRLRGRQGLVAIGKPAGAAACAAAAARPPARAGPSGPSSPARRPRAPGRAPAGRRASTPASSMLEPVPSTRRRTRDGSDARQANSCGTKRLAASSLASGENTWPASPCSGSSAPFRLITASQRRCGRSSAMRAAIAAPAECPISTVGLQADLAQQRRHAAGHAGQRGAVAARRRR